MSMVPFAVKKKQLRKLLKNVLKHFKVEIGFACLEVVIPSFRLKTRSRAMEDILGWYPIMDSRLMWTTVSGFGGAEELLWLERQESYTDVSLRHNV